MAANDMSPMPMTIDSGSTRLVNRICAPKLVAIATSIKRAAATTKLLAHGVRLARARANANMPT